MNIEAFKRHTASRRPVCKLLETGQPDVTFPKNIGECKAGEEAMITGEILFVDLRSHNQAIMLNIDISLEMIKSWSGYKPKGHEIRLSRFKTNYDGMPALAIRIWEEKKGKYVRYSGELRNGDKVKCASKPVKSKGKIYTNLCRDIIILQKSRGKKRKVEYFSDGDM
jgi:hypothetical protein